MLIVTKSPVRISYAGGGSDYQEFFKDQKSFVVNAAINKFVYFISLPQWPLAEDKFRFTYRHTESVNSFLSLEHPVVRQLLSNLEWRSPLNMATMADVPAQSGLGSSSAFTAAAIQNLQKRLGIEIKGSELAQMTIQLERFQLGEPGGWQDQLATAIGGLKGYAFFNSDFQSLDLSLNSEQQSYLESHQMLLATNFQRLNSSASEYLETNASGDLRNILKESSLVAERLISNLNLARSPRECYIQFANAVREHWELKSRIPMNPEFSNLLREKIEFLKAIDVDAYKLLGSGNGGYLLVMANPEKLQMIEEFYGSNMCTRFAFEGQGTVTDFFP